MMTFAERKPGKTKIRYNNTNVIDLAGSTNIKGNPIAIQVIIVRDNPKLATISSLSDSWRNDFTINKRSFNWKVFRQKNIDEKLRCSKRRHHSTKTISLMTVVIREEEK